jgi:hypothetical protein
MERHAFAKASRARFTLQGQRGGGAPRVRPGENLMIVGRTLRTAALCTCVVFMAAGFLAAAVLLAGGIAAFYV